MDYDDDAEIYVIGETVEAGYWSRRQIFITIVALLMILLLLVYLALPLLQPTTAPSPTSPPHFPLETIANNVYRL